MHDAFGRRIHYLRIAVTDRCNLRCRYCMPAQGVPLLDHREIVSFEEILAVVRAAVELGFDKFRLTGGEPLVRRGIVDLVHMLAHQPGVDDLAMTTNGVLLAEAAPSLRAAGLQRVNISLDTLDAVRYAQLTRGGDLARVLAGIAAAKSAGFQPIKLNCVIQSAAATEDAVAVAEFARQQGFAARSIPRMDLIRGEFGQVEPGGGGDCPRCNRVRLTSDGWIRSCLFGDQQHSIRRLGPAEALRRAISAKPEAGCQASQVVMSRIGG